MNLKAVMFYQSRVGVRVSGECRKMSCSQIRAIRKACEIRCAYSQAVACLLCLHMWGSEFKDSKRMRGILYQRVSSEMFGSSLPLL